MAIGTEPSSMTMFRPLVIAGQTIFQIYGANGAPQMIWERYPEDAVTDPNGGHIDRSKAISATKEEFEVEQEFLRGPRIR